ncbi:hypothetical protein BZZ01_24765 [Nostocales cyanobacterium HT-58-2]|nr:hypothetical protein BZZ01_24765 [Nostocales cyanobacterium HT-58-2]
MGEAKRRKAVLGDKYGKDNTRILPWVPVSKTQAEKLVQLSTRITWVGIGGLVVAWVTVRFIGPAFGWWQVV